MKKTHWLRNTLITLVVCGVAGIIVALILFNANPGRTGVSSSIEFAFDGAAEGKAPNGYRFDLSGFTSEEVLSAALKDAGLDEKYTVDQIKANILVSGVYPKDIVNQMTKYESLLTGDAGRVNAVDYHATLYSVTLYNDFDKSIARADLENLLTNIMAEFRTRFEQTYALFLKDDGLLTNLSDYDYPQQLELLETSLSRYTAFAEQMAAEHADFLVSGEGFADIASKYDTLRTGDLERLSGRVTMNALSKDQDRIVSQYENEIRVLEIRLKELTQEAKETEALINQYSKDDIIYVSTAESLQQVSGNSTQTYDTLIARRRDMDEQIAQLNKELTEVRLKLSDITGKTQSAAAAATESGEATEGDETSEEGKTTDIGVTAEEREAQKVVLEKNLNSVVTKLNKITEEFTAYLKAYSEREMNDSTVAVTAVRYNAPKILSGAFVMQVVKCAGPFCVIGFIVCMVGLIVSRVKEEKRAK